MHFYCTASSFLPQNLWRVDPFFRARVTSGAPRVLQNAGSVMDRRHFAYKYIRWGWPVLITAYDAYYNMHTVAVVTRYKRRTRWYRKCILFICGPTRTQHHDLMWLSFPFRCGTCRDGWYNGNGITNRALVARH